MGSPDGPMLAGWGISRSSRQKAHTAWTFWRESGLSLGAGLKPALDATGLWVLIASLQAPVPATLLSTNLHTLILRQNQENSALPLDWWSQPADGDVRNHLAVAEKIELAWLLRSLHHVATGLYQLHSARVAHQDLKPSNILVFDKKLSKVSDLGSASIREVPSPRDEAPFAGDSTYAPPEVSKVLEKSRSQKRAEPVSGEKRRMGR